MTSNERLFQFVDAGLQVIAGRIRWAITGLHLVSLHVLRFFVRAYLALKADPRG